MLCVLLPTNNIWKLGSLVKANIITQIISIFSCLDTKNNCWFNQIGGFTWNICVVKNVGCMAKAVRNVLHFELNFLMETENIKENRLLFQFTFWCLHVAPSKAGGAQRSPRRKCQRMLSPSKCTISLGDFCFLKKLLLAGNTKSDWFVLSSTSFFSTLIFIS